MFMTAENVNVPKHRTNDNSLFYTHIHNSIIVRIVELQPNLLWLNNDIIYVISLFLEKECGLKKSGKDDTGLLDRI